METLSSLSFEEREEIQSLAVKIFMVNPPRDPAPLMETYQMSLDLGRSYTACTITGR